MIVSCKRPIESHVQEQLNIDAQDETVSIMKESIIQRYEIAMETPISQRPPIPKIKNVQRAKSAIEMAKKAINQIKEESGKLSLTDISHIVYATASAVTESLGMNTKKKNGLRNPNQPKWKKKIEREICKIRGDISGLNEIKNKKSVKEKR